MKFLSVSIPKDIQREIDVGNIGLAIGLIDKRLQLNLPRLLKERLLYEKEKLNRFMLNYPYSIEEAKKIAADTIKGFTYAEFEKLFHNGDLDYIIVDGKPYFEEKFAYNIGFKYEEYKKRIKNDENVVKGRELLHNRLGEIIKGDSKKEYKVRAKITVTPDYDNILGEKIKVWLPIPYEGFQIKNAKIIDTSHKDYIISDPEIKQRIIFFKDQTKNRNPFYVEFEYEISEWINNIDISKVEDKIPEGLSEYLEEKAPHILFTHYLKELTKDVVGNETNPYLKAKLIYDWITLNVNYSYSS